MLNHREAALSPRTLFTTQGFTDLAAPPLSQETIDEVWCAWFNIAHRVVLYVDFGCDAHMVEVEKLAIAHNVSVTQRRISEPLRHVLNGVVSV